MRVATDIGGTFTDLVYLDEETNEIGLAKASTTPPDFDQGVLAVLEKAEIGERSDVSSFIHGTTVVINTITERTGSKTALVTTKGFRDVLDITRSNRPGIYDFRFKKPIAFVPRRLCFEVAGRIDHHGHELVALSRSDVEAAAEAAAREGVDAIAVCFLHSYANPEHEVQAGKILAELLPDTWVTLSHEMTQEWREYERSSSAVLNAYVQGSTSRYLDALRRGIASKGIRDRLYVMQSSGGVMSFDRAERTPLNLIESGPVAGVIGSLAIGELTGSANIISFDVGGTTAKTSLVEGGEVKITTDYKIEAGPTFPGYPVKIPVVDIVEIGAGGGSIAWIDEAGGLSVGPRSAGAVPGPACYPNGGTEPTVTDANLLVGRINPDYFLGGEIEVSLDRARAAMESIAGHVGVDVDEAALGVVRMANAKMVNAIRLVSTRRGYDPRDFSLVAFGGGGPMHAAAMAAELLVDTVVVPPAPAHFSAWGMLMTDLRLDVVRTRVVREEELELVGLNEIWGELENLAASRFDDMVATLEEAAVRYVRVADMRYRGQEHTVPVPVAAGQIDEGELESIRQRFHDVHEQHYTFRLDAQVEFVNFRVGVVGRTDKPSLPAIARGNGDASAALKGERLVDFDERGRHATAIYERSRLGAGDVLDGPAVVEEPACCTVVFPDQRLTVDEWGNLVIRLEGR